MPPPGLPRETFGVSPEILVRTKLVAPPGRAGHLARPRLTARLAAWRAYPLTLVSAPVGAGKSTLLGAWARSAEAPPRTAWLTLDARDNDPARFGASLVAALRSLALITDVDQPPDGLPLEAMLTTLINALLDIADDFALVLDDYHVISAPPIHQALAFFLEHRPPQLHVVVATREDPPWPLGQWRARNQLLELRGAELCFTPDETTALAEAAGLTLTTAECDALHTLTEGWVAGLQLAFNITHTQPEHRPPAALSGSHRHIADYLTEQVFDRQPPAVQRFLMETAVVERLTAPLCQVLTADWPADLLTALGPPQAALAALEARNLFLLALDDERHSYRYAALFRGYLLARLRQHLPGRAAELHRRAAQWHEQQGLLGEAVGHALAIGEAEQAAMLIEQIAEASWRRGESGRLLHWLEALPDDLVQARPRLAIFHAWILNILGEPEATEARLTAATTALTAAPEGPATATLRGMLAATRGIVAIMAGDIAQALALSEQAQALLPEANLVWRSVVARNLGNAYVLTGDGPAARQAFQEAFRRSQAGQNLYMALVSLYELTELHLVQGRLRDAAETARMAERLAQSEEGAGLTILGAVHVGLSAVLYEWNDLEASRRHALLGARYGEAGRSLGIRVCAYTRLGRLERARHQPEAAAAAFQRAAALAPVAFERRTSFLAHHDAQAYLWAWQGETAAMARWVEARGLTPEDAPSYLNEAGHLTLARWCLARGAPEAGLRLLPRLRAAAEAAGRWGRVIEMLALEALAHQALGQTGEARAQLLRALQLAEPEGYVRLFVDEGPPMRRLLAMVERQATGPLTSLRGYLQRLGRAFAAPDAAAPAPSAPAAGAPLSEPLSARELEVLRLVAEGRSTQEIAATLVVALSTVQTHMKHLFGKLDVHSRTQAVARARALGLLAE